MRKEGEKSQKDTVWPPRASRTDCGVILKSNLHLQEEVVCFGWCFEGNSERREARGGKEKVNYLVGYDLAFWAPKFL